MNIQGFYNDNIHFKVKLYKYPSEINVWSVGEYWPWTIQGPQVIFRVCMWDHLWKWIKLSLNNKFFWHSLFFLAMFFFLSQMLDPLKLWLLSWHEALKPSFISIIFSSPHSFLVLPHLPSFIHLIALSPLFMDLAQVGFWVLKGWWTCGALYV